MSVYQRQPSSPTYQDSYQLAVVGCGGVGKSALTIQFVQGHFVDSYDPTIEDSYVKYCTVNGRTSKLNVLDTAGQEEFQAMRDSFMKFSDGFLIVFSFADLHSMEAVFNLHKQVLRVKDREDFPMVLVGNKCDIHPNDRRISSEQGKDTARQLQMHYLETSAKLNHNVDQAFLELARSVQKCRETDRSQPVKTNPKKKKSKCIIL